MPMRHVRFPLAEASQRGDILSPPIWPPPLRPMHTHLSLAIETYHSPSMRLLRIGVRPPDPFGQPLERRPPPVRFTSALFEALARQQEEDLTKKLAEILKRLDEGRARALPTCVKGQLAIPPQPASSPHPLPTSSRERNHRSL